jgi:hypothetical protein
MKSDIYQYILLFDIFEAQKYVDRTKTRKEESKKNRKEGSQRD